MDAVLVKVVPVLCGGYVGNAVSVGMDYHFGVACCARGEEHDAVVINVCGNSLQSVGVVHKFSVKIYPAVIMLACLYDKFQFKGIFCARLFDILTNIAVACGNDMFYVT